MTENNELERGHELDDPPYDYHEISQFEQVARSKLTHVDEVKYDSATDEIVLIPSIEITEKREEIIANQLSEIGDELSYRIRITTVTPDKLRLQMPSQFRLD